MEQAAAKFNHTSVPVLAFVPCRSQLVYADGLERVSNPPPWREADRRLPAAGTGLSCSRDEFEGIALASDMTGVKVPADDKHVPVGKPRE